MRAKTTTQQSVLFPSLFGKPLVAVFDRRHGSSDGGAVLLKAADRRLGLVDRLAGCLTDRRQSGKIRHEIDELLGQRVYALACGYADTNDAARLADDPIHKLLVGRDPIGGDALASQPTLSRFENTVDQKDLYRMGVAIAESVIKRHHKRLHGRARRITIDLDPTDDATHGGQQLALFNGYYGQHCYLPLLGFLRFNDEPEQYLFTALLRPGNAPARLGACAILRRVLERLIDAFPKAQFVLRLDGGFANPVLLDFLDAAGVDYVIGMAGNSVLREFSEPLMKKVRKLSRRSGRTEHLYTARRYRAQSWDKPRRVIIKAEVTQYPDREPRDNPRFVITSFRFDPRQVYEREYCQRGDIENRIKELKHGMQMDRTSCTRFWANQFRVLMTAAAYVLMQELRLRAARTACARAQVWTLREHLIKLGVQVVVSVRRIVLHLPASFPYVDAWRKIALALGAT